MPLTGLLLLLLLLLLSLLRDQQTTNGKNLGFYGRAGKISNNKGSELRVCVFVRFYFPGCCLALWRDDLVTSTRGESTGKKNRKQKQYFSQRLYMVNYSFGSYRV